MQETWVWTQNHIGWLTATYNSSYKVFNIPSWPLWERASAHASLDKIQLLKHRSFWCQPVPSRWAQLFGIPDHRHASRRYSEKSHSPVSFPKAFLLPTFIVPFSLKLRAAEQLEMSLCLSQGAEWPRVSGIQGKAMKMPPLSSKTWPGGVGVLTSAVDICRHKLLSSYHALISLVVSPCRAE